MYNTYKFPGKFEKSVTVFWGDEGKENSVITLRGSVDPIPMGVLEVEPRKVTAGEMVAGKPVPLEISIKNIGDADMVVKKVSLQKATSVFIDEVKTGLMTIKPGEAKSVSITVTANSPGNFIEYVLIQSDARNVTDAGYKVVVVGTAK